MRIILLSIIFLLFAPLLWAQVTITGKVTDNKSNPLRGVSISLKDTYDGGTTDSTGSFRFKTDETGKQIITASSIGYKIYEQEVSLEGKATLSFNIILKEEVAELTAVVISAGNFEASDKKKVTVLGPIDIVTTAGANADIVAAMKTLPGAQQIGESEGLFVRGGTAAETKIFIDGTLVNNFFYSSVPNIAQRGRFSPFIFKGTVFSTGGYSALYGQALSSALILESIDLPEKSAANIGVSVIGANAGYQHLAKNKKSSWGIGYGYTNLELAFAVIKQKQDFFKVPEYHTGEANFRIKTSSTGIIKYYGYFSANRLGFRNNSLDSLGFKDVFQLKNFNHYHNLAYKESLGNRWKVQGGASYSTNNDDIKGKMQDTDNKDVLLSGLEFKNFSLDNNGEYINGKVFLEKGLGGLSAIRFGTEYNYSDEQTKFTLFNGQSFPERVKEHINSGFAESDIYLTNALAAKVGTRLEHSNLLGKTNIGPRASLAYKTGKSSQASMAYGIFYQNPERRFLPSVNPLTFAKAAHYIAQYQKVDPQHTIRAEIFYKKYEDLVKTGIINGREIAASNNGFGDAKGFELFWRDRKTIKNLDYWISYSYLDTKRDFANFPFAIQPNFAAKHTASLVMKKFVTKWKTGFNSSYNYASSRPFYNIQTDGSGGFKFNDRGETPDFHNVSFSLNYLPGLGKTDQKIFTVLVLSVSNIFGIKQTFGYQYSANGIRKEPIVPPSRSFVFIGAFISIGVDRTQDAINNNL